MTTKEEILNKSRAIIIGNYYIYALLYRNEIVYIGQSTSLITRLAAHVNSNKVFDAWSIIEALGNFVPTEKFNAIERSYVSKFKPKYNKHLLRSKPKSKKEKKYEKIYKRIRANK